MHNVGNVQATEQASEIAIIRAYLHLQMLTLAEWRTCVWVIKQNGDHPSMLALASVHSDRSLLACPR